MHEHGSGCRWCLAAGNSEYCRAAEWGRCNAALCTDRVTGWPLKPLAWGMDSNSSWPRAQTTFAALQPIPPLHWPMHSAKSLSCLVLAAGHASDSLLGCPCKRCMGTTPVLIDSKEAGRCCPLEPKPPPSVAGASSSIVAALGRARTDHSRRSSCTGCPQGPPGAGVPLFSMHARICNLQCWVASVSNGVGVPRAIRARRTPCGGAPPEREWRYVKPGHRYGISTAGTSQAAGHYERAVTAAAAWSRNATAPRCNSGCLPAEAPIWGLTALQSANDREIHNKYVASRWRAATCSALSPRHCGLALHVAWA